jgi:LCP family protein required for cell wall assembly
VTTPAGPSQGDSGSESARDAGAKDADASGPQDAPDGDPAPAGGTAVAGNAAAGRPRRRFRWLRVLAVCVALLVLVLAGGTWYVYQKLNGNITTDKATETELKAHDEDRPAEGPTSAENILLIGSDNRGGGNGQYGQDSGTQRSDTTILLHLAADGAGATAVSIPRDLMAHVPSCRRTDGTTVPARFEQFNWAFEQGGAACTIRTVENMTGVRIDHHLIVDFKGFKNMVNAVDGVEVCVDKPVHDTKAHLDLPAGRRKLNGEQALGFVRARYSIGDGSDTGRMDRQQDFLASLLKKVRSNGVLLNPLKLYPLLNAATSSLTADPGLNSLDELYGLAHGLQRIPAGDVHFLTLPQEPYTADHNRDQLLQPAADDLFAALREDRPVPVSADAPTTPPARASSTAPSTASSTASTAAPTTAPAAAPSDTSSDAPTAVPTYRGTTANRDICGKDR